MTLPRQLDVLLGDAGGLTPGPFDVRLRDDRRNLGLDRAAGSKYGAEAEDYGGEDSMEFSSRHSNSFCETT